VARLCKIGKPRGSKRDLREAAQIHVEGDVRILITDGLASYWLMPRLPRMLERYPGLLLNWQTLARRENYQWVGSESDICVTWRKPINPELVAIHLGSVGFSFFASEAYIEQYGLPTKLEDLAHHSVLQFHGYKTNPAFDQIVIPIPQPRSDTYESQTDPVSKAPAIPVSVKTL